MDVYTVLGDSQTFAGTDAREASQPGCCGDTTDVELQPSATACC